MNIKPHYYKLRTGTWIYQSKGDLYFNFASGKWQKTKFGDKENCVPNYAIYIRPKKGTIK